MTATGRIAISALVVFATVWVLTEPLGKGPTLLAITPEHGVDVGDIPALLALGVALLAGWWAKAGR